MDIWYRRKTTDPLLVPYWTQWVRSVMEQTSNIYQGAANRFESTLLFPENLLPSSITGSGLMVYSTSPGNYNGVVVIPDTENDRDITRIAIKSADALDLERTDLVGDYADGLTLIIKNEGFSKLFKAYTSEPVSTLNKALKMRGNLVLAQGEKACFRYEADIDGWVLLWSTGNGYIEFESAAIFVSPNTTGKILLSQHPQGHWCSGYVEFTGAGTLNNNDVIVNLYNVVTAANITEQFGIYGNSTVSNNPLDAFFATLNNFTGFIYDVTAGNHMTPCVLLYENYVQSLTQIASRIVYKDQNPFTYAAGDKINFSFPIHNHQGYGTGDQIALPDTLLQY